MSVKMTCNNYGRSNEYDDSKQKNKFVKFPCHYCEAEIKILAKSAIGVQKAVNGKFLASPVNDAKEKAKGLPSLAFL